MKDEILELRRAILRFRDELMLKSEEERNELDQMVIETSQTLADALIQYQRRGVGSAAPGKTKTVTSLLRAYNAVNRQAADIEALELGRMPIVDE